MAHYSTKPLKTEENLYTNFIKPRKVGCSKLRRCNDFRTCPTCSALHKIKTHNKRISHLKEDILITYKYKYLLTFKTSVLNFNYSLHGMNKDLNNFMEEFTKCKRLKDFAINKNSQYIFNKEISHSKSNGYLIHNHMILLSDKEFDINNPKLQKLLALYDIDIHVKIIKPKENSYKKSISKIFNYMNKFNATTIKHSHYLKGEHSNKHTDLFKKKKSNIFKSRLFTNFKSILESVKPTDIKKVSKELYKNIIEEADTRIKEAKTIFKRNKNKKHTKNYLRLLKSLKNKLHKIEIWKKKKIHRLKAVQAKFK